MDPFLQLFFEEAVGLLDDAEAAVLMLEANPADGEEVDQLFRCVHTLKGNSALVGLQYLTQFAHKLEDLLDQIRTGRRQINPRIVNVLFAANDVLRGLVSQARDEDSQPSVESLQSVESALAEIESFLHDSSEQSFAELGTKPHEIQANELRPALSSPPLDPQQRLSEREESATIRVPVERVDMLANLAGELVIAQSIVSQIVGNLTAADLPSLRHAVDLMDRHTRELHDRIMTVRMIPLKQIFQQMQRLVRDLASSSDKAVVLEVAGEQTELDKSVIERIGPVLTHLTRNAFDHGLESTKARCAAGKPATGTIRLQAHQQGGNVFVEVADDGQGLRRERILAKAVERGLAVSSQPLTDEEAFSFIFLPGFSTVDQVTDVSGRGVGLDVVRRSLDSLGGGVSIRSTPGQGTTFRIKLPLTVAVLDGQVVQVGGQVYLLPLLAIVESVQCSPQDIFRCGSGAVMASIRGRSMPVLDLQGLLDLPTDPGKADLAVVVEHDGRRAALMVNRILAQQQVVIKSLEENFQRVRGIAGATILADGCISLILDVPELLAMSSPQPAGDLSRWPKTPHISRERLPCVPGS